MTTTVVVIDMAGQHWFEKVSQAIAYIENKLLTYGDFTLKSTHGTVRVRDYNDLIALKGRGWR